MARAAERQRQQAQLEAAAVLQQLEAEDAAAAAGSDAEPEADDTSAWGTGNKGRLSFGAGPNLRHMVRAHVTPCYPLWHKSSCCVAGIHTRLYQL